MRSRKKKKEKGEEMKYFGHKFGGAYVPGRLHKEEEGRVGLR